MKNVAGLNGLSYGKDVKQLTIGKFNNYMEYLNKYENKTKFGVVFCLDYLDVNLATNVTTTIPCTFEYDSNREMHLYTVLYNVTNSPNGFLTSSSLPWPKHPELTRLKVDIDNSYLKLYTDSKGLPSRKMNATIQSFPVTQNRFLQNADIVSSSGAFYFLFPPMICFVVLLLEIIREKDLKLRKSLLIIGLNNTPHWISWWVAAIIFSFLVSFILIITGIICNFDVFKRTNFFIALMIFFLFTMSMQFMAFFLTTILKTMKSAYTVSYAFILVALVMEIFLTNDAIIFYLYSTDLPWWVGIIKFAFSLYPPFNFAKCYSDIASLSASHFDNTEFRWKKGNGYHWDDLTTRKVGTMQGNINFDVPTTLETIGYLCLDMIFYGILAWYFDHVDSSNRGKSYSKIFCFQKSYWCKSKNSNKERTKSLHTVNDISQISKVLNAKEQKLLEKFSSNSFNGYSCILNINI
jgi:hypothetical protein